MQAVEHVDERRVRRQLGHPMACHSVWGDDAVGARELEAPDRFRLAGARDHVQLRIERAGGEHDIDGALIGVDGRDQAASALDAGVPEHVLRSSVADDVQPPLTVEAAQRLRVLLDDDVPNRPLLELSDDLGTDAAVPADDVVVAQALEPVLQLPPSPVLAEPVRGQDLGEDPERVEHRSDATDDQGRGEHATDRAQRVDLAEPDGGDRADSHVERVERVPALEQRIAEGAGRASRGQGD